MTLHKTFALLALLLTMQPAMSKTLPEAGFHALPAEARVQLDRQRAYVAGLVARHLPGRKLTGTQADFATLQELVDLHVIQKDKTWELQSLGVVFGDALASTIPGLAWCEVTDVYGTDPTLRYKQTSLQINALTMISKRIEDGQEVHVADMASWLQDFIKNKSAEYR